MIAVYLKSLFHKTGNIEFNAEKSQWPWKKAGSLQFNQIESKLIYISVILFHTTANSHQSSESPLRDLCSPLVWDRRPDLSTASPAIKQLFPEWRLSPTLSASGTPARLLLADVTSVWFGLQPEDNMSAWDFPWRSCPGAPLAGAAATLLLLSLCMDTVETQSPAVRASERKTISLFSKYIYLLITYWIYSIYWLLLLFVIIIIII